MTTRCPVCCSEVDDDAASCPHCGFRLQGSTQQFRPIKLSDGPATRVLGPHQARLIVLRGPQTGLRFDLRAEPMTVGRSPQCDVFLNDMTVSRVHASILPVADGYVISDENSFNGVWVNNVSIDSHRLAPNDIVQIGAFLLLYEED